MKTRTNPFVRITGAFVIGILATPSYNVSLACLGLGLAGTVLGFLAGRKRAQLNWERCFTAALLLAFGGLGALTSSLAQVRPGNAIELTIGQRVHLTGEALEDAQATPFGFKVRVRCQGAYRGKLLAYLPASAPRVEQGQVVEMLAQVRPLPSGIPGYANWLRTQQIFATARGSKVLVVQAAQGLWTPVYRLRRYLAKRIRACMPDAQVAGLACAMLLGDRSTLDQEMRADFGRAGLSHVLAISGLHVGIVFAFLSRILGFLAISPTGARLRTCLVLGILVVYMVLSGGSPAVCRAVLMLSLLEIGKAFFLHRNSLNLLAVSAFLFLLMDPMLIFQAGFQLSYAAVAGIFILGPALRKRLQYAFPQLGFSVVSALSVCIAAQAFTAPLVWYHFGQFPTYFLLSNLLLLPVVSLSVILGFWGMMSAWIPGFGEVIFGMLDFALVLVHRASAWIGQLPGAVLEKGALDMLAFQILVLSCLSGIALLYWREIRKILASGKPLRFPRLETLQINTLPSKNAIQIVGAGLGITLLLYLV